MYRGFSTVCSWPAAHKVRLIQTDAGSGDRPSLVSVAQDAATGRTVVVLGDIYYFEDLVSRLKISPELRDASAASIVLAVFQRHGKKGLEHLEGEFALVVLDETHRRVYAQRDPMGCWPLFWSVTDGVVTASTSVGAIVSGQARQSFNMNAFAEFLMQPMPADELASDETMYAGIQRVRPGNIVELSASGQLAQHRYWDWDSHAGHCGAGTMEEAAREFGSLLRQSVRERMPKRGQIAAHLSGGMDSSSLVCLAREELLARSNQPSLRTLSLVYDRRSLVGERSFIDLVLQQGGPVSPHFLQADDTVYFDWFQEKLPRQDEPSGLLRSMPNHRRLVRAADECGAIMTLSGEGSDEIACYQPYYLANLVRRGRWLSAIKSARDWASGRNRGLFAVLRQYGLEPIFPLWFREGSRPFLNSGFGAWPHLGFFSVPPWIRSDFARRYEMRQRGRNFARRIFGYPTDVSWNSFMLATTSGDWERWHLAAPLGMNLSHPFKDPRLISFTLGLPHQLRGVPGMTKPLLQIAMRGLVPPQILAKRCSPGFDDVYGLGLRRNMPQLERLVRSSAFADLKIINPENLISVLHQAALGIGDAQATDRVDKTLSMLAWFEQIQGQRAEERFHDFSSIDQGSDACRDQSDLSRRSPHSLDCHAV